MIQEVNDAHLWILLRKMQKIFSGHSIDFGLWEKKVSVSEVQGQKSQATNIFISDDYLQEKLAEDIFPSFTSNTSLEVIRFLKSMVPEAPHLARVYFVIRIGL